METLSLEGRLLYLATLLHRENVLTGNGKAFFKEMLMRKGRAGLLPLFDSVDSESPEELEKQIKNAVVEETLIAYEQVFSECSLENGKSLSREERERIDMVDAKSLIYGEVDFRSFSQVLRLAQPLPGSTFYDLGSGTGRAVFAAAMLEDFHRVVGIEILSGLYQASTAVKEKYDDQVKCLLDIHCANQEIELYHGSFLDYDWSDGDVVFANSTCFDEELMQQIAEQAESMKPGSIFISFTKSIDSPVFNVVYRERFNMSWGPATVYIHRRQQHVSQSKTQIQNFPPYPEALRNSLTSPQGEALMQGKYRQAIQHKQKNNHF